MCFYISKVYYKNHITCEVVSKNKYVEEQKFIKELSELTCWNT